MNPTVAISNQEMTAAEELTLGYKNNLIIGENNLQKENPTGSVYQNKMDMFGGISASILDKTNESRLLVSVTFVISELIGYFFHVHLGWNDAKLEDELEKAGSKVYEIAGIITPDTL